MTNPLLDPHRLARWPALVGACEAVLANPKLQACAAALLGGEAHLHQTALYDGSPGSTLHRDDHPFDPSGAMVAVIVALEDIEESGGPLVLYPGTHAIEDPELDALGREVWVRRFLHDEPGGARTHALAARIEAVVRERTPLLATLRQGDALWWSRRTVHGSLPGVERSGASRRSFIAHFTASAPPRERAAPRG